MENEQLDVRDSQANSLPVSNQSASTRKIIVYVIVGLFLFIGGFGSGFYVGGMNIHEWPVAGELSPIPSPVSSTTPVVTPNLTPDSTPSMSPDSKEQESTNNQEMSKSIYADLLDEETVTNIAVNDLAGKLQIVNESIEVVEADPVSWGSSCAGCMGPRQTCLSVVIEGWWIKLEANNNIYYYHSGGNNDPFLCDEESRSEPVSILSE